MEAFPIFFSFISVWNDLKLFSLLQRAFERERFSDWIFVVEGQSKKNLTLTTHSNILNVNIFFSFLRILEIF